MYQRNGRFEKRVTFDNGETKTFYGATEREVKQKIKAYAKKLEKTSYTLAEAIEMRTLAEGSDWSPSTRRSYGSARQRLSEGLLNTDLDELKAKDINAELRRLAAQGYAKQSINVARVLITAAIKYALAEDLTDNNPLGAIKTPPAPVAKRNATTDETAEQIIKYRHDGEIQFLAYFTLLTGMRRGEALALTWDDIDFDKGVIRINKTVVVGDDFREMIKPPKSKAGYRLIPMVDMLRDDLKARKDAGNAHVVNLTLTKADRLAKEYGESLGAENWSLHCNRHAFATQCVKSGVDVKTAQDILGHADISTTMNIYAEVTSDMRQKAAEKLSLGYAEKREKSGA